MARLEMDDEMVDPIRRAFIAAVFGGALAACACAGVAHACEARSSPPSGSSRARRIDLELQDAGIHDVLDLFAEIGKVSIVVERGIPDKKVTARLQGVPWDEALAAILRSVGLGMIRDGSVIYVVPTTR